MIYIKIISVVVVIILIIITLVFINVNTENYTSFLNAYSQKIPEKNGSERVFDEDEDDNNYEHRIDQERVNRMTQVYNRAGIESTGIDYGSLY